MDVQANLSLHCGHISKGNVFSLCISIIDASIVQWLIHHCDYTRKTIVATDYLSLVPILRSHCFCPTCLQRMMIQMECYGIEVCFRVVKDIPVQDTITRKSHYENTPIQIYRKFHLQKTKNFQIKNSNIFHISAQNIDCGYSLEPPQRGGSNEYHNRCFWAEIRKIIYTPVNPSFTI